MTDRPLAVEKNTEAPKLDWNRAEYADGSGQKHQLASMNAVFQAACARTTELEKLDFPKAADVLSYSNCMQEKQRNAEQVIVKEEVARVSERLGKSIREAALAGHKQALIATFEKPSIPNAYSGVLKQLHENGFKTSFVAFNGMDVEPNKPLSGPIQMYHLVAKF